jgi:hypothetical protein
MTTVKNFVENYKAKRFMNTKQGVDERVEWIRKELEVKEYLPFREKRQIAEMIVEKNTVEVDGIKKYDFIDGYMSFIIASIMAHTALVFSDDPVSDYDMLAESGLLPQIIAQFQSSHDEIDLLRKMILEMEMEDNNTNALIGRFLNKISGLLDGVVDTVKDKFESFDLKDVLGEDFKKENIAQLMSVLNKLK